MKYSKRVFIYIMCSFLSFYSVSISYSKAVHAMEWVGGALAFEEALKWLLGAMGITAVTGFTADYWEKYGDDFVDYAVDNGATQTEVANWKLKLCEGILDKGSDIWLSFKVWASSLVGSGNNENFSFISGGNFSDLITALNSYFGYNVTIDNNSPFVSISNITSFLLLNDTLYIFNDDREYSLVKKYNSVFLNSSFTGSRICYFGTYKNLSSFYLSGFNYSDNYNVSSIDDVIYSYYFNMTSEFENFINLSDIDSISDFNSLDGVDQKALDIVSSAASSKEEEQEVVIPMPGLSDSDNTASADAYDKIIDLINSGEISLDDGVKQIQDLINVVVYNTDTDDVVPIEEDVTGDPIKVDDKLKENKDNFEFTLAGLENVFPFCIPWDIYAFISLLEADPVAPKFEFPFRDPKTHEDVYYIVDLSPFDSVAVVVRYGFDLLFIIGLALVTRALIGAGNSGGE